MSGALAAALSILACVPATAQTTGIEEAMRLAAAGRAAEAEQILLRMEKVNPRDPEIQYRLGLMLLRNGKLGPARARLESAAKLDPNPLCWLALAQVRLRLDDLAGALQAAANARRGSTPQPEIVRALTLFDAEVIKYHLRRKHARQALELSRKAVANSDAAVFHNLLGQAHEVNHDSAAAAAELQNAIRLDPNQPKYYLDLAELFLNHNTAEPAELVLMDAARRFPRHPEILRLLGVARYALGKTNAALDAFLEAIDAAPDSEAAYASLETLLPAAGPRLAEIVPRLRQFAKTNPSSPLGPYLIALALPDESEAQLRTAVAAAPDFWAAWFELSKVFKAQQRWTDALAALRKTVALKPDFAPAHYALAEYYSRSGDHARAAQEREQHHKLLEQQKAAAEKLRTEAPRLSYTLSER